MQTPMARTRTIDSQHVVRPCARGARPLRGTNNGRKTNSTGVSIPGARDARGASAGTQKRMSASWTSSTAPAGVTTAGIPACMVPLQQHQRQERKPTTKQNARGSRCPAAVTAPRAASLNRRTNTGGLFWAPCARCPAPVLERSSTGAGHLAQVEGRMPRTVESGHELVIRVSALYAHQTRRVVRALVRSPEGTGLLGHGSPPVVLGASQPARRRQQQHITPDVGEFLQIALRKRLAKTQCILDIIPEESIPT